MIIVNNVKNYKYNVGKFWILNFCFWKSSCRSTSNQPCLMVNAPMLLEALPVDQQARKTLVCIQCTAQLPETIIQAGGGGDPSQTILSNSPFHFSSPSLQVSIYIVEENSFITIPCQGLTTVAKFNIGTPFKPKRNETMNAFFSYIFSGIQYRM